MSATATETLTRPEGKASIDGPSIDISQYPKLDRKQAGHLRHFYNLVSQPDGQWHHFDTADGHHEFDDAARYQLATMAYASAAAHYHRLPALRGPFKTLFRQIIHKMLRREVWSYWFNASLSGNMFDPDLKELRKPWPDPVVKENIMYSGHLLLMTSLYAMLFDDDEFEQPGSIKFRWNPLFYGFGPEEYVYDNRSLEKVILQQMEENEWVGVCCEPNAIFVVCNQYPILAMRYNDVRDGTNVHEEVLVKYKAALAKKGMVGADGLYATFFALKQNAARPAVHGAHTAWANVWMHAYDAGLVESRYDQQTLGFLTKFSGKTDLNPARVAMAFRRLVVDEGANPNDVETLHKARETHHHRVNPRIYPETLNWGTFSMMLSELGKKKELDGLLEHADARLNPTWEKGGLFYPRNDKLVDEDWNLTHVEPFSGNSAIGYSRLNVPSGNKKMWERPWTSEILASRPWVDGIQFANGVDFLRGIWDEEQRAMIVTLKRWQGAAAPVTLGIRNLPPGQWKIYVNGRQQDARQLSSHGDISFDTNVGEDEVDIVVQGES